MGHARRCPSRAASCASVVCVLSIEHESVTWGLGWGRRLASASSAVLQGRMPPARVILLARVLHVTVYRYDLNPRPLIPTEREKRRRVLVGPLTRIDVRVSNGVTTCIV